MSSYNPTPPQYQSREMPLDNLVLGITAFNRPKLLERLVASVREFYPSLPIMIADNGWQPADLTEWSGITMVDVEDDCGLSASRNALAAACPTPLMCLAEEDFVFTDKTDLAAGVAILDENPELGMIGGSLIQDRQVQHYARNFRRERHPEGDVLKAIPAGGPMINQGDQSPTWRKCSMVFNWGIIRRDLMIEVPWDEDLKLGEHADWFLRVGEDSDCEVGPTLSILARHDRDDPGDYSQHRNRAAGFLDDFRKKHGLQRFEHTPAKREPIESSASVVVMGVGHSGTTIVTRMLESLGWYAGPAADDPWLEHPGIRDVNEQSWSTLDVDLNSALDHLDDLATPWVIKDPRFVHTLDRWYPILGKHQPTLVWVVRDLSDVADSYARRGETYRGGDLGKLADMAKAQFESWPWAKVRIDYEKIADAISLFDLARAGVVTGDNNAVPPQAEPRMMPPPVYDGEPGGPCVCEAPGDCRRHPAVSKQGRLFDICQGNVLTLELCESYRRQWDEQALSPEDIVPPKVEILNDDPFGCAHMGDYIEKRGTG